ncbi:hypothetical protein [Aminobacter niigataensis]|uniref:hypothetical protein n=1 Tax=Aminobacter niigataensis TaxID=83265 RepID=UPI0024C63B63|nr:hypothetical protein [Aminobacter niigataensis]CAI2934998.1 putative Histone H1-like protein Hc1 [Aminobacter niigataensis]
MEILQFLKNALSRLVGRPGPREPANLGKAGSNHKAFNETARLDKVTKGVERAKNLSVERKANLVETSDIAARKKKKKVDDLIDKAAKLSASGEQPDQKKAATTTVKSAPQPAKPTVKPVKTKPKVQKKT